MVTARCNKKAVLLENSKTGKFDLCSYFKGIHKLVNNPE